MAKEKQQKTADQHYKGHRDRLRQRFINGGAEALQDYEMLELIMFRAIPRRDVKPMAKDLIKKFGDLSGVLSADRDLLREIKGISENVVTELKIVESAAKKVGQSRIIRRQALKSWDDLVTYCRTAMAEKQIEEFRALFLDRQNQLIADEVLSTGTVDYTPVYPREVMKRALALSASAMIIVHNHPSGDSTPSKADIQMTKQLDEISKSLGIVLHDHLIIARGSEYSFKSEGLL